MALSFGSPASASSLSEGDHKKSPSPRLSFSPSRRGRERERERETSQALENLSVFERFVEEQVKAHAKSLEWGDDGESEDCVKRLAGNATELVGSLVMSYKECQEKLAASEASLHIERTRRETKDLQMEERTHQLQKAQEYSHKYEDTIRSAQRQQEEAQRRLETQYRDSELRHERRHEQELKLRTDLEQRLHSLRNLEKQLRERLQAERKAREAAEAAQRQMLQRHLHQVKSPLANGGDALQLLPSSSSSEGQPVSLGYSLDNMSEITAMNHNLLTGQKNSYEAKVKELEEQLGRKEQELDKARLSLKRQEHQNAKLIEQNEDMMENIGVYEMEKTTPGGGPVKPAAVTQSPRAQNGNHLNLEPLSVLANTETALSYAVFRSISSSFGDFYDHLESVLAEVVATSSSETSSPVQQSPERKHFMKNIILLSKERCKICIETSVNKVLLEILEDDRPVVINGQAHSSHALFEKVCKELARLRTEVETWKERSASNAQSNSLFEDLTLEFEQCQKDREELRAECLTLKGKVLLATNKDGEAKLVQAMRRLQEENKHLLSQQATSNKLKKVLEKKISEFVEKEVAWEKDLNKFKRKLKIKAEHRRTTTSTSPSSASRGAREIISEPESERDIALRNMLLECVNKSIAAVKVAKENDLESLIASEEKKDPTFAENWQAIFEFNQRLSQDGESSGAKDSPSAMTTPSTASPPIRTRPVSMTTPLTMPTSPILSTIPVTVTPPVSTTTTTKTQPLNLSSGVDLEYLDSGKRGGFSSSTKDALFRLNRLGKPSWQAQDTHQAQVNRAADTAGGYAQSAEFLGQMRSQEKKMHGATGKSQSNTDANTPKGYLPFARQTDEALDYAIKNTAAGIHRRLSQARMTREEMIHRQVYPSSNGANSGRANIVPPSPGLSSIPSSQEFSSNMASADQHISELSRLKKECERYKRQMFKAEKEAIRARSDLNEVVDELMEVKSTKTPQQKREGSKRRGPRHQRNH